LSAHGDPNDALNTYWKKNVINEKLPYMDIVFVGTTSSGGSMPIHDRWWAIGESGLEMGGSMNGLGKKIIKISKLSKEELYNVESKFNPYLNRRIKEIEDERLEYRTINI